MLLLSPELDAMCFSLFVQCEEFDNNRSLRAIFVTIDLAPFADGLPERTGSKKAFVTQVKLFLLEKRLKDGRALLLPFLDTLRGRYPEEEALHGELDNLYQRMLALYNSAEPGSPDASVSISDRQPEQSGELDRAEFREKLVKYFNLSELKTICFDMSIEYGNFRTGLSQMAEDLIAYCERNGRTNELLRKCRNLRPHVNW